MTIQETQRGKLSRREFLHASVALAATAALPDGLRAAASAGSDRPNVLLILTDDQGYGDLHCHGNSQIDTPTFDRLAADGAELERFYVSPVCAPTRAALLTGRYPRRCGVSEVMGGREMMRLEEITVAQVLRSAGYATGCFGKWHNGELYPYTPNARGFDEFFGFQASMTYRFDCLLERNGRPEPTRGYLCDVITDAAIEFIRAHRAAPFFCYLPYHEPHSPVIAPDKYFDKYRQRGLVPHTAGLYAMVESVDANVARVLRTLDDLNLSKDTIVIFLSDNGPTGIKRYNAGMTGIKGQCNEGGIRVPCFIRWPGKIVPGTKVQPIAAHIDLLPTLAAVCGAKHPQPSSLDGRSLLPLLTGQQQSNWSQRTLFEVGSVRTDRWRLMIEKQELFDMPNDPGQKTNVAAANPEVVRQLTEAYRAWDADMRRGLVGTPPPLPVGHKESPRTLLRTHLAQVNGAERNSPWPSGYINPWTRTDASVTWKLDVATAGRYAVRLNYVCAKKDLGAQLRIEAGGRSCTAIVDREADPTPMETYDRVPRTGKEANVLRWATLPVGSLLLDRGPVTLRVSVPQMPGQQAFAMSGVELELQPSTS